MTDPTASDSTHLARGPNGRWRAGQSGNPGGRPRTTPGKELARRHAEESVQVLITIMRDAEQPATARLSAARILLEHAEGKATQQIVTDEPKREHGYIVIPPRSATIEEWAKNWGNCEIDRPAADPEGEAG